MIGYRKDGGPLSKVEGWFLESKRYATLALLRFLPGTREAFHEHAFDCVSIVLGPGYLIEEMLSGVVKLHHPGSIVITKMTDFHKVKSIGTTYVITLRGPWRRFWREIDEKGQVLTLTHNRLVIETRSYI